MPRNKTTRTRLTQQARDLVWQLLGHECALQGVDDIECDGPLEVDHPHGRDWVPRRVSIYNRWRRYLREARMGLVRPLCKAHNERVRPARGRMPTATTLDPF